MKLWTAVMMVSCLGLAGCAGQESVSKPAAPACELQLAGRPVTVSMQRFRQLQQRHAVRAQTAHVAQGKARNTRLALGEAAAEAIMVRMATDKGVTVNDRQLDRELRRQEHEVFLDADLMHEVLSLQGWSNGSYREHARALLAQRLAHLSALQLQEAGRNVTGTCLGTSAKSLRAEIAQAMPKR
jgi:hypothetical protein